jgi:hypothetical protein
MFHPKVAFENLEIKFNERPFYLGGSNVPLSLGITPIKQEEVIDDKKVVGTGLKAIYQKNRAYKS